MATPPAVSSLRLTDRLPAAPRVLFVGINPGVRSAMLDHHFAGHSNRFWRLLFDAGLTPELLKAEDDARMMEWGFGLTNLVARPTPGIDTLRAEEYVEGLKALRRKVRRLRPRIVALVGVTLFRFVFGVRASGVQLGLQSDLLEGAAVFVLPNPSGRNAHYSYETMFDAFRALAALMAQWPAARRRTLSASRNHRRRR